MKTPQSAVSLSLVVVKRVLLVSLVALVPSASGVSFQRKTVVSTTTEKKGSTVEVLTYDVVPEATEACTLEESEWWKQLRNASNDLQKKRDAKSKSRFALLLYEGMQRAYHVPLKDRPPQVLVRPRPPHSELIWTKKINGSVVLSIEYRADGTVGEVQMIKGVGFGMDENVIQAAREALFLPAIKNAAFVTERQTAEVKFSTGRN